MATINGEAPPPQVQVDGSGLGPQVVSTTPNLELVCGPLLNYRRMSDEHTQNPVWHGSVLIVTTPGQRPDQLSLRCTGPLSDSGMSNGQPASLERSFQAIKLYEDPRRAFFNYEIDVPFQEVEAVWEYHIPRMVAAGGLYKGNPNKTTRFVVASKQQSFRIMFHSCNGFSVGTDEDAWSGPALWQDVMRVHAQAPFHVMIGGGDQIYNDSVRVKGPLKPWTAISNPRKRRDFPFDEDMRGRCDQYYFDNYVTWYGTESFATANGQIPQLNIWDDHDIIDGFGSYTDHFMKCPVFRGIGGVAHKYYLLFQHHLPPPASTFTTGAPTSPRHHLRHKASATNAKPQSPADGTTGGVKPDPVQLENTFVKQITKEDPSYIIGQRPGPYVEQHSRNMYCQLGKRIAFAGIDARTERTRHQINYPETYDLFFKHISSKFEASHGEIKHLVLLLGVPIAYPRLQWLENILQSPLMGPIKFLNKRFGVAGGLFNQFDGGVDLLDDLDDHYTAHQHKKERKDLILRIQNLAKKHSVRVSILGGDVHLSALGRFYSKPELNIPAERDFRYMPNIISSAITNKPPPQPVANLLAKRNKIHHLDHETDETLLELFDKQPGEGEPGVKPKSAPSNHCTMPSRNYAIICESHEHNTREANGPMTNGITNGESPESFSAPKDPRQPLHKGEEGAGTSHPAAEGLRRTGLAGLDGLDVTIRVEKNPSDREGHTHGYGLSVPALDSVGHKSQGETW